MIISLKPVFNNQQLVLQNQYIKTDINIPSPGEVLVRMSEETE